MNSRKRCNSVKRDLRRYGAKQTPPGGGGNGRAGGVSERVNGIEPSYAVWETAVLPLNYTRIGQRYQTDTAPWRAGRWRPLGT